MTHDIHIIGGGLAGSEAAWQLAQRGFSVRLSEMRGGGDMTPAHQTDGLAELVCSNSFRSDDSDKNAVGLLHHEMRELDSLVMRAGEKARVPAGSAMAVDRDVFSAEVQRTLDEHPKVTVVRERVDALPDEGPTIVATGPLTAQALAESIVKATGQDRPPSSTPSRRSSIATASIWISAGSVALEQAQRGLERGRRLHQLPYDEGAVSRLSPGLMDGEKTEFREWEKDTPYFEGCMPIEVMASRGVDTLRFGPMKPVGLDNPRDTTPEFPQGRWPYAVVQLRQDNKLGTLWNMVGFQTKLKYGAQVELFRTIPGLENAEFARLGGLHRNTFLNSPVVLDRQLRLKGAEHIRFAGQVTGCEGYVESSAVGLVAGMMAAAELAGREWQGPPRTTALGALLAHITGDAEAESYQPMNVNFGLFPPLHDVGKKQRKEAYTSRAKADLADWIARGELVAA